MNFVRDFWHREPAVILGVVATIISVIVGDIALADAWPLVLAIVTRTQVSPTKRGGPDLGYVFPRPMRKSPYFIGRDPR